MTPEEEKDFAEKVIRLSYKCASELHINREDVMSNVFIKWLMDKIDDTGKEDNDETKRVDIFV